VAGELDRFQRRSGAAVVSLKVSSRLLPLKLLARTSRMTNKLTTETIREPNVAENSLRTSHAYGWLQG
jgi:hypothetical protein